MKNKTTKKMAIVFAVTLAVIGIVFAVNVINVKSYNNMVHCATYSGTALFSENAKSGDISVSAIPRGSSWTKAFDLNNEGLKEHNYQAYTYDITVSNNTKDEVRSYSFKLTFGKQVFLLSGWNGSVEIHQKVNGGELVSSIPDLRDYKASEYAVKTVVFDGDTLISMKPGDYLVYYPSTSDNAVEMPIAPHEGTVPGFILYTEIGTDIGDSTLEISYKFHRVLTTEPLFWISAGAMCVWLIALIIFVITSAKIRKYRLRHERDNKIINESIETFTGFIDAKDPYTNGHSKRVAKYTRFIAEKMGYEGEELDRIYYVALLHDCGKIGVPDNILGKPGKLTDEEFQIIKSHTVRGGEILDHFKSLEGVNEGALYHHERYDGKGYPKGLAGEDIPLIARIICVADSFDAMNSNRVYRKKLTKEYILNEIESNKGRQFDPAVADVMLKLLRNPDNLLDF
ncbi:MAG: HD-GYP domain-containing protein [Clostridia bacterium]|nr:HD-GYP domain-containing protein [Clostridia bacterium]